MSADIQDLAQPELAPPELPAESAPQRPGLGLRYGQALVRWRWVIAAIWMAALLASIPFAGQIANVLQSGGYNLQGSESVSARNAIAAKFHHPPAESLVVFQADSVAVAQSTYQSEIAAFIAQAKTLPHVTTVTASDAGQDNRTMFVTVDYDVKSDAVPHMLSDLRQILPAQIDQNHPARAYITGGPALDDAFSTITSQDIEHAEIFSLPLALLALIVIFGTLVAAALPLLLAVVAVPIALAVLYAIAAHSWTSIFVLNIATIIGLGISIDYSLFMTRRFREELAAGQTVRNAVARVVATAGEAILFSGMTVVIGFAGLFLIGVPFMSSIGIGGMVVVAFSVLAALTLLPALLAILGHRVNALKIPVLSRLTMPRPAAQAERGLWHRLAWFVMRRPVPVLGATIVLLIALGWPVFAINPASDGASALPANLEATRGLDIFNQQFPAFSQNPIEVVVQTPDGSNILNTHALDRIEALSTWLATRPHVTSVTSLTHFTPSTGQPVPSLDQLKALYLTNAYQQNPGTAQLVASTTAGDTTVIAVTTDAPIDSVVGKALIDDLRAGDHAVAQDLRVLVGGAQAESLDFTRYLYSGFPKTILFVLLATFVVLLVMFRSVLLPLKAVLVNTLSLAATYGALVFIFQQGHFESFFGFTHNGTIDSTIPILIFCVLFGLSMDYEVFLLSRIREEWNATHDNQRAVARGLAATGAVITNAALLFVIVTGAFTFTRLMVTKEIGFGMTMAVLVDATIIRSLLVPATMRLLGRWNWWFPGQPVPVERKITT